MNFSQFAQDLFGLLLAPLIFSAGYYSGPIFTSRKIITYFLISDFYFLRMCFEVSQMQHFLSQAAEQSQNEGERESFEHFFKLRGREREREREIEREREREREREESVCEKLCARRSMFLITCVFFKAVLQF